MIMLPWCHLVSIPTQKTPPSPHSGVKRDRDCFHWVHHGMPSCMFMVACCLLAGPPPPSSSTFDHFSTSPPSLASAVVLRASSSPPRLPPQLHSGIMFASCIDFWDADAVLLVKDWIKLSHSQLLTNEDNQVKTNLLSSFSKIWDNIEGCTWFLWLSLSMKTQWVVSNTRVYPREFYQVQQLNKIYDLQCNTKSLLWQSLQTINQPLYTHNQWGWKCLTPANIPLLFKNILKQVL